ncbi:MAG: GNAT family N-acetyltransferase [Rhodanobacter sp.]
MPAPAITIETDRLILRPTRAEDFEGWATLMADGINASHIGGPQPRSVAWRGFLTMAGAWTIQGFGMFSVIEKVSGRWIGRLGPWCPDGWPGTEVGWGLLPEAWGNGYAPEGAVAAMDWAFGTLGWHEIIHCIAPDNTASQVVARKLGSRVLRPGRMPEPYHEHPIEIWGQTREQWFARRR